jgi:DNA mismatch repair ATPase MutS
MKPFLLYRDQDFYPQWGMIHLSPSRSWWRDRDFEMQWEMLPAHERMVTQDLELDLLFSAMARGDKFLFEVVKNVVLLSLTDTDTIRYRQGILKDCMKNPDIVRNMYTISVESIEKYEKIFSWYSNQSADSVRSSSIQALELFVNMLTELRNLADEHGGTFESEGFRKLFAMLDNELTDEYFASIQEKLGELKFPNGLLISAEIGKGNKGTNYALHRYQKIKNQGWIGRFFAKEQPSHYSFTIHERDINGFKALAELKGRGMNKISNTLGQSSDHILNFFTAMKTELAFYIGCLNLSEQLTQIGEPVCFPIPFDHGKRALSFEGLYDVCLALKMKQRVVGNDANAENKDLVIITGANRGGKSTLLRSLGLAQLMMQCGSFVPAKSFRSDVCDGIFTHFKREEDHAMRSGKLDEELSRMSEIVDHLTPDCMVLFNESFAATNEREGSEISRQIVCALLERRIKVIFVTHLYEFSQGLYENKRENALFLRAERKPDGERTFRVTEGEPLQTSYGEDLYNRIFLRTELK